MTEAEFRELCEWGNRRDERLYGWLRHLTLLGAGSLTLLASLRPDPPPTGREALFLKAAWVALGLGTLLASVRLYAEPWTESERVRRRVSILTARSSTSDDAHSVPISFRPPWYMLQAERACYLSFALGLVCLVASALCR